FACANAATTGGYANTFVLNNIFSDGIYVTGCSAWLQTTLIGGWDYNLSTPPNIPNPAWFLPHNIKSTTNQWTSVQGMSFALPSGSQAINAALDTSSTFTLNGKSFSALPDSATKVGTGWSIGALEYGVAGSPPPLQPASGLHVVGP